MHQSDPEPTSQPAQPPSLRELRAARGGTTRSSRGRRLLITAALTATFLLLLGFFALPPLVRSQTEKHLSDALDRKVSIAKIKINPLALSFAIEGLSIAQTEGTTAGEFLGWNRIYINFEAWPLLLRQIRFLEIAVEGLRIDIQRNTNGAFNFDDLVARFSPKSTPDQTSAPPPSAPSQPWPLVITKLTVTGAQAKFADHHRPHPFETSLGPITFSLHNFRTVGDPNAPYRFEAITDTGEKLAWNGTISTDPLRSRGELCLQNIDLARLSPYYHSSISSELRTAKLDLTGGYLLDLGASAPTLRLTDGTLALHDIRLGTPGAETDAFALRRLEISGVDADAAQMTFAIQRVAVEGLTISAIRDAQGIDLVRLITPNAPPPALAGSTPPTPAGSTAPSNQPRIRIAELSVSDVRATLTDLTLPRRAELKIDDLTLSIQNIDTTHLARALPFALELRPGDGGFFKLEGNVTPLPTTADLTVEADALGFASISPFLEQFIAARLVGGSLRMHGRATLRDGAGTYAGNLEVAGLRLVDSKQAQDFLRWETLSLNGVQASTIPLTFHADEIRLAKPYAAVRIETDGSLNVGPTEVAPAPTTPYSPPPTAPSPSIAPTINVGAFVFENAKLRFEDRSISPAARTALTDFQGRIKGLSSATPTRADVDIHGLVDGLAPVSIIGRMNPLGSPASMDLTVDFRGIDLQPVAGPYIGRYVGRELARGNLNLSIRARLDDRALDTDNVVTLDQFTLGTPTGSPDATKLPVGLALALLRDTQGRIVIDLPVKGSLDNPNFKIGRVVLRVLVNLLTKAATSPFTLLGAAFGGGGDELGWQDFPAGSAELNESGIKKLETVARALNARPALNLDILGAHDPATDAEALRRTALEARIRAAAWEDARRTNPAAPPPESLELTDELRLATVARLFAEAFPPQPGQMLPIAVAEGPTGSLAVPLGPTAAPTQPTTAQRPPATKPTRQIGRLPRYSITPAQTAPLIPSPTSTSAIPNPSATLEILTLTPEQQLAGVATLTLAEMEQRLAASIEVPTSELEALASARAQAVRTWLVDKGGVPSERIFLAPPRAAQARTDLILK